MAKTIYIVYKNCGISKYCSYFVHQKYRTHGRVFVSEKILKKMLDFWNIRWYYCQVASESDKAKDLEN